jgi:alanine-glyoxylate transaminase/serine-glyoxylate transaminase/serine-pyruvate transaminase
MELVMAYWGETTQRAYHHTAPVNSIYALHEALIILEEEGLENAWARHQANHLALEAGLEAIGLELIVPKHNRLPQLNSVKIPEGVDEATIRRQLLDEYQLEIGAGLGPLAGNVWRIGLMGYASNRKNVLFCLGALEAVLNRSGGVAEARAIYSTL